VNKLLSYRDMVRSIIKLSYGDHMQVRFSSQNGRLYCKVIDSRGQGYNANMANTVRGILESTGASEVSMTSTSHNSHGLRVTFNYQRIHK
jgi:hypothetical protein